MSNIRKWCNENSLILNEDKTNVLMFSNVRSNCSYPGSIVFENAEIPMSSTIKLLGVTIDSHLNWGMQCELLSKKLNSVVYTLRAVRNRVNTLCLKTIYYSNFQSLLSYGLIFWGASSHAERVFITQKLAIRTMFHMKYRETCRGVFKQNKILTLPGLYIYRVLLFFHKNNFYFEDCLNLNATRRMFEYFFPVHKLSLTEHNVFYMCIRLYNYLPKNVRDITDHKLFKSRIFAIIVNCEPYTLIEFRDYCKHCIA